MQRDRLAAADVEVRWSGPRPAATLLHLLDRIERTRLAGFRSATAADHFATGRAVLRLAVASHWQVPPPAVVVDATCRWCGTQHGRPRPVPPPDADELHVAIAHTDHLTLVALTRLAPVGVDVEPLGSAHLAGFADVALSAEERQQLHGLAASERDVAQMTSWVRKEAVLKATGHGLTLDPRQVVVSHWSAPAALVAWADGPVSLEEVQLAQLDVGTSHVACLAVLTPGPLAPRLMKARGLPDDA